MTVKLHRTITRQIIDEPAQYDRGHRVKDQVAHEETTPLDPSDRGRGGTIQTHVAVDGPVNAEFTEEEATEVVKALVLLAKVNPNDPDRKRRIERILLRMGLDPADLTVFDD